MDRFTVEQHASTEQLLEIKDGLTTAMSEHVADCKVCQRELDFLIEIGESIGAALLNEPLQAQPECYDRVWQRVQETVTRRDDESLSNRLFEPMLDKAVVGGSRFSWNSLSTAVYSLAIAVMFTGFIALYSTLQRDNIAQQTEILQASIDDLMLNSHSLEVMLQQVASQSSQLSESERRIADRLYWRLSYLDQMISENAGADGPASERVKALWGNRVEALTDLNQLYSDERLIDYGAPNI